MGKVGRLYSVKVSIATNVEVFAASSEEAESLAINDPEVTSQLADAIAENDFEAFAYAAGPQEEK